MEDWQKVSIAVMTTLVVAIAAFGVGLLVGDGDMRFFGMGGDTQGDSTIAEAYDHYLTSPLDPPTEKELREGALRGMCEVQMKRDPYANCYDAAEYRDIRELTTGGFSGIGVSLQPEGQGLRVVRVLPNSPAQAQGLRKDDLIVEVDGRKVVATKTDLAIERIKGRPGTKVAIVVNRNGEKLSFQLKRERLELPNVTARLTKRGNAHVQLFGFAEGASEQTAIRLQRLVKKGADGVILDLRNNPGGLFREAVKVSSLFLKEGEEVVIYKANDGGEETYTSEPADIAGVPSGAFEKLPLVVLVNGGSASASEIVAGALQDTERARLVGSTTFGKAAVQSVQRLQDGSALKFTVATYLTPDGRNIDGEGIKPDVQVADPRAQLRRAEAILGSTSGGEQG
jgi:carboxyl-terminal processing protease